MCRKQICFDTLEIGEDTTSQMMTLFSEAPIAAHRISTLFLSENNLEDFILCPFLSQLTNVTTLDVQTNDEAAIATIFFTAHHVKQLTVGCVTAAPLVLSLISTHFPDLEQLSLDNSIRCTISVIISCLKQLTNLREIMTMRFATDQLLHTLAHSCPHLRTVALSLAENAPATDDGMLALAQGCRELRAVTLWNFTKLTDTSFVALAENCPALTLLSTEHCVEITDVSLHAIAQHCPQLQSLRIESNSHITGTGVIAIAQNCPLLSDCSLHLCMRMTDAAVVELTARCVHLSSLSVHRCRMITDEAIKSVFRHCKALHHLNAAGCQQLTSACFVGEIDVYANALIKDKFVMFSTSQFPQHVQTVVKRTYSFVHFMNM